MVEFENQLTIHHALEKSTVKFYWHLIDDQKITKLSMDILSKLSIIRILIFLSSK